MIMIKLW